MINNTTTSPLRQTPVSSHRPRPLNWRERGVGIARIIFGLVWVIAALLQWLPQFQNSFVAQVAVAKGGQPALIQGWISFWANAVSVNPLLFARILASTEAVLAAFLLLGPVYNLPDIRGHFLSLGLFALPPGVLGPLPPGTTTGTENPVLSPVPLFPLAL